MFFWNRCRTLELWDRIMERSYTDRGCALVIIASGINITRWTLNRRWSFGEFSPNWYVDMRTCHVREAIDSDTSVSVSGANKRNPMKSIDQDMSPEERILHISVPINIVQDRPIPHKVRVSVAPRTACRRRPGRPEKVKWRWYVSKKGEFCKYPFKTISKRTGQNPKRGGSVWDLYTRWWPRLQCMSVSYNGELFDTNLTVWF